MSWNYRNKFATTSESGPEQDLELEDVDPDSSPSSASSSEDGEAQTTGEEAGE